VSIPGHYKYFLRFLKDRGSFLRIKGRTDIIIMNPTMRVLLQDRQSRLYFGGLEQWTPDIARATNFEQLLSAIEFVRQNKQAHLDILMTFGEPRYDVRIAATP